MKKNVILGMLIAGMSLFADVDLKKHENVDSLALASLSSQVSTVDETKAGRWYLKRAQYGIYRKVKNNEFELNDAIESAYKALLIEVQKNKPLLNEEFSFTRVREFGKYNFKGQYFPIKDMITKSSHREFSGDKIVGSSSDEILKIKFDNTNKDLNKLIMTKDKAKELLSSIGRYRNVNLKYTFKIKSIDVDFKSLVDGCNESFKNCKMVNPLITGHIVKVDIYENLIKNPKHFATINFENAVEVSK